MRLHSIVPIAVRLPLRKPIKMSGITVAAAENLLVRIEDEKGNVGWGEAASAPTMTGDLPAGLVAAVEFMRQELEGLDVEDLGSFAEKLETLLYGNEAAKSAVDMAVHDLRGRREGVPAFQLLGGARRSRTPVLWILAAGETGADVAEAKAKVADGFVALKVKVGNAQAEDRVARDLERSAAVREAVGNGPRISADANQGYAREEGVGFSRGARQAGLDFIEQPIRGRDLEGMQSVVAAGEVPVGADEGIHSLDDLVRHHEMKAAHGGSLKILKLGGMAKVMEAGQRAEALGMHINLAGKIAESSVGSAAIAHLAVALPQIDWDASVTNQYLAEDVVKNPIAIRDGHVAPPQEPGLGVVVDEARVARFAYRPGAG